MRYIFLAGVATLLIAAMGTVAVGFTTVKMLPHDNKSELQVDDRRARRIHPRTDERRRSRTRVSVPVHVLRSSISRSTSGPLLRSTSTVWCGTISCARTATWPISRSTLSTSTSAPTSRTPLPTRYGRCCCPPPKTLGVNIKVAEIPPGPPVLSTLVAEVYGPTLDGRIDVAQLR